MSGIFGILSLDGAAIQRADLLRMAHPLERRGPEGTAISCEGSIGLGHTLLATTPEAALEKLPLKHTASGVSITGDIRLDNRDDLSSRLKRGDKTANMGDAGLVLEAYLAWGEDCVAHFLGDFAFAIWDPRSQKLFCARDHFGMRPFNYYHKERKLFAFASEPRVLLVVPYVPQRINEARIADFLVDELEAVDTTSTFFEEIYRLPPAHLLIVSRHGLTVRRYWTLEPASPLHLSSDEAYAEAFLAHFTEAVRCRLRSTGPVGSMLSGGMDSGSVVAVARKLLAKDDRGRLSTFSAVGPVDKTCVETQTIKAALTMEGLDAHLVNHADMADLLPELAAQSWSLEEPFDNHMTLVRAVYIAAHARGIKVMLDGVAGDVVLGEGNHLAHLVASGHWALAWREAVAQNSFWKGGYPPLEQFLLAARAALVPLPLKRLLHPRLQSMRQRSATKRTQKDIGISAEFASRIGLQGRLSRLNAHRRPGLLPYVEERADGIMHPNLVVARERYDRVAASSAIEPRDPFLDRRLVEFCVRLPGVQLLSGGWPKIILRRAMAGLLPDVVRWRKGKEHLGYDFTKSLYTYSVAHRGELHRLSADQHLIAAYLNKPALKNVCSNPPNDLEKAYTLSHLLVWLDRNRN